MQQRFFVTQLLLCSCHLLAHALDTLGGTGHAILSPMDPLVPRSCIGLFPRPSQTTPLNQKGLGGTLL